MKTTASLASDPFRRISKQHWFAVSLTAFVLLWITTLALADTYVNRVRPGGAVQDVTLTSDTVFTATGSPYIVEGNLGVNATLTVSAGVAVKFNSGKGLSISGRLLAANATFIGNDGGGWRGIYSGPGSSVCVLNGCMTGQATAQLG